MTLGSVPLDAESHLGSELCHSGPETLPGAADTARKPKVLLLLHDLSRTGAPRSGLAKFDAMRAEFDVRVIAPVGGPLEEDCRALWPLDILSEIMPHGRIWQRAYGRLQWRRWLREFHRWAPDLIYINSVVALPIARMVPLPDVPVILQVCELQGYLLPILRDYPDLLVGMPTRYLAVSDAVRRALVSDCGIDQDRIGVIHEFIPERRLDEVNISQAGRRDDDALVIGGAGAVAWYKGTTLWLQTAAEVRRLVGPTARFVWVGAPEGDDGIKLRREVHLLGLDDAVELIPSTPRPLEHFARFDIFAMTSWEDPCPLVVLENMGLGKPVVCFAGGGGAPEEVGDTGVIVPEFDPRAMARAIADLAADPRERARLGGLARQRMRANFTDRVQVPKFRREVRLLTSGKSTAQAQGPLD